MGTSLTDGEGFWGLFSTNLGQITDGILGTEGPLEKLKNGFNSLGPFFDAAVSNFGSILGKLPSQFHGPINAVVDVLNGFGDIWNKVADKLGLPKWEPLGHVGAVGQMGKENPTATPIGARWMGGPGGPVRGPGGPKEDKAGLYRLSAGEHVWTADEVAAAGGHDAMYRMRKGVLGTGGKQSKADGPLPGYADGGIVATSDPLQPIQQHLWDLVSSAIPGAILTSGQRFVDVGSGYDLHMQGKAIDLAGPMDEIARWIYDTYPQSAELIHWPLNGWSNLDEGKPFDFGSATNEAHRDHVHWAANDFLTQLSDEEKAGLFDRVKNALGSAMGAGRGFALDNLVRKPLNALVDRVPDFPGMGEFGQIPKAFARKMADAVTSFISSKLGGSGGGLVDYEATGNVERWRDLAKEAMRRTGFNADDENQVNAMMAQIKSESGGNPSILQQVQDVNSGGNEAQGLLQVIPGTFAAYRDPSLPNDRTDPMANMVAALNYYRDTYGSDLTTEWGHGHGYANGGWVNGPGGPLADKIRALLSNGEFVVNAAAAGQWGPLLEAINGGAKPQAKTLEQRGPAPFDPNQPPNGGAEPPDTNIWGGPPVAGVDTVGSLKKKTMDRFFGESGAFATGFNSLVDSTLGPLGLPDPRDLIPSEVTAYAKTFDEWNKAKAQAPGVDSQALLNQSGYYQAGQHAVGAANQVVQSNPSGSQISSVDNSMTVNLTVKNDADAFRKLNQMADLRAIPYTG
ncbi:transglycosylase SLT domain-containing protein [Nocardia flavorosea]|uniref:Transglycosylase SLT domain-containing protein n=2 Tax=Nocardia flavorosea TaxID=53429 RepID=A0A846YMT1_9NOCA|nr:transglycosylase SLT domain-containing protein [Nocardia flavorosea]